MQGFRDYCFNAGSPEEIFQMLEPVACRIFLKSEVTTQDACSKSVFRAPWTEAIKCQVRGAESRHKFFSIGTFDVITAVMLPEISMPVSFMSAKKNP